MSPRELRTLARFRRIAGLLAVVVAIIAMGVLIGWVGGVWVLTQVVPGLTPMRIWTACMLMALSGWVLWSARHEGVIARAATACVVALLVLANGAFLVETMTHTHWGIDDLLGLDHGTKVTPTTGPGRPSQLSSVCFLLLAGAVWGSAKGRVRAAQTLVLAAFCVAG